MIWRLLLLYFAVVATSVAAEADKIAKQQLSIADQIQQLATKPPQVFLYTIYPQHSKPGATRLFHGYTIDDLVEIDGPADKDILLKAFASAIRENRNGEASPCFNPSHALRIVRGVETNDFVISFECGQVAAFGFNSDKMFFVGSMQKKLFDTIRDRQHFADTAKKQAGIADQVERLLGPRAKVVLYSIEPGFLIAGEAPKWDANAFNGAHVLGSTPITTPVEQEKLVKAFAAGIRGNAGVMASCFNPRHGLRIVNGARTNDFLICFECMQVVPYGDITTNRTILTDPSPRLVFDAVLDQHHVPKAKN